MHKNAKQVTVTELERLSRYREWVNPEVWTDRMLTTLETGVKRGKWYSLYDKVCKHANLENAFLKVEENDGSPGIDGITTKKYRQNLAHYTARLVEDLKNNRYQPKPIQRTYIDKPGSKEKRPLGIPVVRDRVCQTALRNVIEPIFEKEFSENSYGFRPGRGCKDALRQVMNLLKEGYRTVIDADIKSYFDNLDFGKLMKLIEERICDKKVLKLIEQFLKQDIVDDMNRWSPDSGTPQGAVISPLLANIYLHPFDVTLEQTGAKMVRYADDFIVFCKSNEEAENILKEIKTWMADACLQLHPDKTSIVDLRKAGAGFDFLGYHFQTTKSTKRITKWPSDKSIKKLKSKIQPLTRRCNGFSMHRNVQKINEIFMGWFEYFKHSGPTGFERLDSWVRQRLRAILKKRQKRKGIAKGADFKRWPLSYFEKLGLFSLKKNHDLLRQSLWSNC